MKTSVLYVALLLVSCSASPIQKNPPNIVLILADDLGYDDLSHRGNNEFLTPNIDALGYHGKILKNLYTAPVCTPTRSSLLTGKFPIRTGFEYVAIRNQDGRSPLMNLTTFAEELQGSGYSTHLVGKWHLGMAKKEFTPTYRGFDSHFGYWGAYIDYYTRTCLMDGNPDNLYGYDFRRDLNLTCESPDEYVTDLLTNEAERIIADNNGNKPLFLLMTQLAPHAGNEDARLQAPAEDIEKFSYIKDENRRTYAAMVHKLDQSVGRVVQALDNAGILNNTIIVFSSDNGAPIGPVPNFGSNWPFRGQKNSTWEGGSHVGGVIWSSLLNGRGSIFEQTMHYVDWFPTLASAAGIKLEDDLGLDGINFWNELTATSSEIIDREIVHFYVSGSDVISFSYGPWKYIKGTVFDGSYDGVLTERELVDVSTLDYTQEVMNSMAGLSLQKYDTNKLTADRIETLRSQAGVTCNATEQNVCNPLVEDCLFNLVEDPCEQNNLIHLEEYKEILDELLARFEEYRIKAYEATGLPDSIYNEVTYHNCAWSNFLDEPPTQEPRNCTLDVVHCPSKKLKYQKSHCLVKS